jgi:hypothetical protein
MKDFYNTELRNCVWYLRPYPKHLSLILKPLTEFSTEKLTKIKRLWWYGECQMTQFKSQYLLV